MLLSNGLSRSRVLAANRLKDRINSDCDPAFVITIPKVRLDLVFRDIERRDVRQRAFQSVANLDIHFAVVNEHEQDDSIATLFLTNAPRLRNPLCVIRNIRITLHLREDGDHDLIRRLAFKLRELLVKPVGELL